MSCADICRPKSCLIISLSSEMVNKLLDNPKMLRKIKAQMDSSLYDIKVWFNLYFYSPTPQDKLIQLVEQFDNSLNLKKKRFIGIEKIKKFPDCVTYANSHLSVAYPRVVLITESSVTTSHSENMIVVDAEINTKSKSLWYIAEALNKYNIIATDNNKQVIKVELNDQSKNRNVSAIENSNIDGEKTESNKNEDAKVVYDNNAIDIESGEVVNDAKGNSGDATKKSNLKISFDNNAYIIMDEDEPGNSSQRIKPVYGSFTCYCVYSNRKIYHRYVLKKTMAIIIFLFCLLAAGTAVYYISSIGKK